MIAVIVAILNTTDNKFKYNSYELRKLKVNLSKTKNTPVPYKRQYFLKQYKYAGDGRVIVNLVRFF